jgi:hypothetical protein
LATRIGSYLLLGDCAALMTCPYRNNLSAHGEPTYIDLSMRLPNCSDELRHLSDLDITL